MKLRPLPDRESTFLSVLSAPADAEDALIHAYNAHTLEQGYEETGNAGYLLEAYTESLAGGWIPSERVLGWVGEALSRALEVGDAEQLPKLLNLRGRRGQPPPLAQVRQAAQEWASGYYVWKLTSLFRISIADAAFMVAAALQEKRAESAPSASWVEERYRRKWVKQFEPHKHPAFGEDWDRNKLERYKRQLLSEFPAYSLPHGLK